MKMDPQLLRRYVLIKELIDNSYDILRSEVCDYAFSDFLEEVCWQVSDHMDLETVDSIEKIHRWVRNNFNDYIRENFDNLLNEENCDDDFYDDVD